MSPRERRGEARVSITYSTSIFISNSLLASWLGPCPGPPCSRSRCLQLCHWLPVRLQAGCKVRDLRQFRHLSLLTFRVCTGERERGDILLQTLVMHHCCPASHNILLTYISFPDSLCHFKHKHQQWMDTWYQLGLRMVVVVTVRMFLIPIKL